MMLNKNATVTICHSKTQNLADIIKTADVVVSAVGKNVIKGEMSLVGPRAVIDGEIEKFGTKKNVVLSVKPGITGYWAANGRSDTTYEERVEMETYYAKNSNVVFDFKILFKTVMVVIKHEGAV